MSREVRSGAHAIAYDLNGDSLVNDADRDVWVNDLAYTYYGDAQLDGEFSSADFVEVFAAGGSEDGLPGNSGWANGDWNGDAGIQQRGLCRGICRRRLLDGSAHARSARARTVHGHPIGSASAS